MGSHLNCVSAQTEHGDGDYNHPQHRLPTDHRHRVKILFLDVDGVLNGSNYQCNDPLYIDVNLLYLLKGILDVTKCKIVLSTTWRRSAIARAALLHFMKAHADINVDDIIIGDTPSIKGKKRAFEIETFLSSKEFLSEYCCTKWCAIDDLALHLQNESMKHHFVQTDYRTGITSEDCYHCIQILNESDEYSNSYDF